MIIQYDLTAFYIPKLNCFLDSVIQLLLFDQQGYQYKPYRAMFCKSDYKLLSQLSYSVDL